MALPCPLSFSRVGGVPPPYDWLSVPVDVLVFNFLALKLPVRGSAGPESLGDGDDRESLVRAVSGNE